MVQSKPTSHTTVDQSLFIRKLEIKKFLRLLKNVVVPTCLMTSIVHLYRNIIKVTQCSFKVKKKHYTQTLYLKQVLSLPIKSNRCFHLRLKKQDPPEQHEHHDDCDYGQEHSVVECIFLGALHERVERLQGAHQHQQTPHERN